MAVKDKSLENLKPMPRLGAEPLAAKPLCVKVAKPVDEAVRSLDNPSAWLREIITQAAIEQGLVADEGEP
jgi:hypothetical protein